MTSNGTDLDLFRSRRRSPRDQGLQGRAYFRSCVQDECFYFAAEQMVDDLTLNLVLRPNRGRKTTFPIAVRHEVRPR